MQPSADLFLARAPFIKLLLPFACGILFCFYHPLPVTGCMTGLLVSGLMVLLFRMLGSYQRLKLQMLQTVLILLILFFSGILIAALKDTGNRRSWFGRHYAPGMYLVTDLEEQPVEKSRSYKAAAVVKQLIINDSVIRVNGKMILYFKKEPGHRQLNAGDRLVFKKEPQTIRSTGNPGAFDYRLYARFNGITHQVYLTGQDVLKIKGPQPFSVSLWLYRVRASILAVLKEYIKTPREAGLAEALLMGYRDDLDKSLLQSYTDTGVVHVIAVSGMHLGLIYWLLELLLGPLLKRRQTRWLHPVLVLTVLWTFSLLAGGAASIVRAAVMFTCILLGKHFGRNVSVYNTLAASAFLLLGYNPWWLWDVGFQLSYAAVLGIVIFYRPLYGLITVENKLLNAVWQLIAISIAAQVLTTPLSIYHFHQFPVYFLISNLLVVPLSSGILIGTLLLVAVAPFPAIAAATGVLLRGAIVWMNRIIENLEHYPFALWKGLQISMAQVLLLYVLIAGVALLLQQRKTGLWMAVLGLSGFIVLRGLSFYQANRQSKIIVYNSSGSSIIDFINGRDHFILADTAGLQDPAIAKNTLEPSAIRHRLRQPEALRHIRGDERLLFGGRSVLLIHAPLNGTRYGKADLVVLTGNPRLYISRLLEVVQPRQVVIGGSVPAWKARYWQQDCDALGVPCYNVVNKGAFVMTL
ncbi:ComEC/Rec2 family competence protein [Niabella beijingensis]|uniref:ComEC/Rec2 family competence protein n=1 Tax=Niabella beijingensis TaxID=2872700 RepID=UPI001CBB75A1|nr:ComEC/Rec2 family competence protein [Niabella beijingensis]MBZ4188661.1 ComEC family competence protein [Niabella beijingensis]